ncbi:MAG: germination protein YpeB [Clostridia bacterium]|nr:germination protein YpeB [Clostridia bacterium]
MMKRGKIRMLSFAVAVIAALSVWGITETVQNNKLKKEMSVSQQRTVTSLADYVDSLANDLRKMQYVNTSTMASTLSLSLCKASAGAKNCLSSLSSGDTQLSNINKFLTQSSDYVQSLTKRVSNGETLSEQDHQQIKELYNYAVKLSEQISYLEEVMFAGGVDFEDVTSTLSLLSDEGDLSVSYSSAVSDAEDSFSDYPTLIYDGPYADNMLEKESEMLKSEKEISETQAKKKASQYCGIKEENLIRQEDENGKIKAYVFYCDGTSVAVTKNGGYLMYMLSDTFAGEEKLSADDAIAKAREYLEKIGFSSLKDSYYSINDGICTVNFAYTLGDVICYADLIKVGVALDTGKIVSADAEGYLMNHKERTVSSNVLSQSAAQKNVSANLTVTKIDMAIIPMSDGKEVYTYEFLCNDKDGNDVLVYIDAQTGKEADIKLLLYSDGGILTR